MASAGMTFIVSGIVLSILMGLMCWIQKKTQGMFKRWTRGYEWLGIGLQWLVIGVITYALLIALSGPILMGLSTP